jgi:hypothetical protein
MRSAPKTWADWSLTCPEGLNTSLRTGERPVAYVDFCGDLALAPPSLAIANATERCS